MTDSEVYSKIFDSQLYQKYQNPSLRTKAAYEGHTVTAAQGGETIPTPLADWYIDLLHDSTFVRQKFKTFNLKEGSQLEIPRLTAGNTMYHVKEGRDMTAEGGSDGASSSYSRTTWDSKIITVDKVGVLTGFTVELAEDSLIDIARMVMENGAIAMAEGEETAFILGSTKTGGNEIGEGYTAGQPSKLYDGLVAQIPWESNSGVVQVSAAGWTSSNTGSGDNIIDAGQSLLTFDHLNELLSIIEDKSGNGRMDTIVIPPKLIARMRNPVEFEMFQSIDKIGNKAALLRGYVGDFYGANVISSGFLPVGTDTTPMDMDDATNGIVTNSTDSIVLGFDSRAAVIVQKRGIEMRTRHNFYKDVEEVRFIERVGFDELYPQWTAGIFDVKNAAVI